MRGIPTTIREFPSLTTERLRLRAPDINDAEPFRVLLSIPEVTRFSNWSDAPKKAEVERGHALDVQTVPQPQWLCLDHRG